MLPESECKNSRRQMDLERMNKMDIVYKQRDDRIVVLGHSAVRAFPCAYLVGLGPIGYFVGAAIRRACFCKVYPKLVAVHKKMM